MLSTTMKEQATTSARQLNRCSKKLWMIAGLWLVQLCSKARACVAQRSTVLEEPIAMRAGSAKTVRESEG